VSLPTQKRLIFVEKQWHAKRRLVLPTMIEVQQKFLVMNRA
jgi:hypothetical protein